MWAFGPIGVVPARSGTTAAAANHRTIAQGGNTAAARIHRVAPPPRVAAGRRREESPGETNVCLRAEGKRFRRCAELGPPAASPKSVACGTSPSPPRAAAVAAGPARNECLIAKPGPLGPNATGGVGVDAPGAFCACNMGQAVVKEDFICPSK